MRISSEREVLQSGKRTCISRALDLSTNQHIVLKSVTTFAQQKDIRYLKKEYEVGMFLTQKNCCHTIKFLDWLEDSISATSVPTIVQEYGGQSLSSLIHNRRGLPLGEFLGYSLQLAEGLQEMHDNCVIHKDIKPNNVVVSASGTLKYIDFGSASFDNNTNMQFSDKVLGTLSYVSPEQTGRINRTVDYRTDFYSLGITLYEALCGECPFIADNALELVYCHIAKEAVSPFEFLKNKGVDIPPVVSEIIMKCMRKNPEDRYQSASGLVHDLKLCLSQFQNNPDSAIDHFTIAQFDVSDKFSIPNKLYGREEEISRMLDAYHRTVLGSPEVLAVRGYSGVGKSKLIEHIQQPVCSHNGYFLSGKFDQVTRSAYSAIAEAFTSLIKQLLTESDQATMKWKKRILDAVKNNGQVVIDVIPELEKLIGKQPPIPDLIGTEAQTRFTLQFQKFLNIFCSSDHPMVIFLDDIQWADAASLSLIQSFIKDTKMRYLLLIVAYRDNEVSDAHPAMVALDEIQKSNIPINTIVLGPLSFELTHQWITDILHNTTKNQTEALVKTIYSKTNGNPFFVQLMIRSLYNEKLLYWNEGSWTWDFDRILMHPATENVIELCLHRMSQFSKNTQYLLQVASCLGNWFLLANLELVSGQTIENILADLDTAINNGLVYVQEHEFHFSHDRVQEACSCSMKSDEKIQMHLHIGQTMFKAKCNDIEDSIQEIVDHYNKGSSIILDISDLNERENQLIQLVKLNMVAATKAKNAVAYSASMSYLQCAVDYFNSLFTDQVMLWNRYHSIGFELYKMYATAQYLTGQIEKSNEQIDILLTKCRTTLERGEVYSMRITQETILSKMDAAIATGREALPWFGILLGPSSTTESGDTDQVFQKINKLLKDPSINNTALLNSLPEIQNPEEILILNLIVNLMVATYLTDQELFKIVVAIGINFTIEHGLTSDVPLLFVFYASSQCAIEEYVTGIEFGQFAVDLVQRYANQGQMCRTFHTFAILVQHWFKPLRLCEHESNKSYHSGIESGELQYAGYSRYFVVTNYFFRGEALEDVLSLITKYYDFVSSNKNQLAIDIIICCKLAAAKLMGDRYTDKEFLQSEQHLVEGWQQSNPYAMCHWNIFESMYTYLMSFQGGPDLIDHAYCTSKATNSLLVTMSAHYAVTVHYLFHALNIVRILDIINHDASSPLAQKYDVSELEQTLAVHREKMKNWSDICKVNYLHKHALLEAEVQRIRGVNDFSTLDLYDLAIEEAKNQGFIHEYAISNELAYRYLRSINKKHLGSDYLKNALIAYARWGATVKLNSLLSEFPEIENVVALPNVQTTFNTNLATLDLDSVIRTSQIISGTIELEKLLVMVMKIVIETAGAQNGAIVIDNCVEVEYEQRTGQVSLISVPVQSWSNGCVSLIEYVARTKEIIVLSSRDSIRIPTAKDYLLQNGVQSVMCMPLSQQSNAILYLENNITSGAFSNRRQQILSMLASQMAISIENAKYFEKQIKAAEKIAEIQLIRAQEAEAYRKKQEDFIDTICHELRNPLNGMFGYLDLLSTSGKQLSDQLSSTDDPMVTQCLNHILEATSAMQTCANHQKVITDDVLTISKIEANQYQLHISPFDPNELVSSSLKIFESIINSKGLQISLNLLPENVTLSGDPNRLTQVIINVLSNAIKFTQHGEIHIRSQILNRESPDDALLEISIKDTGEGMTEEEVKNLYTHFWQSPSVSSEYEGSGLGLYISKHLVSLMSGTILTESVKYQGTTVTFTAKCPIIQPVNETQQLQDQQEQVAKSTGESTSSTSGISAVNRSLKCLIAEDNSINQKVLGRILTQAGHNYKIANNGLEALQLFESEQFDLILMDVEMPLLNGVDATIQIREKEKQLDRQTTIIGISGNARKEKVEQAFSCGMDDYMIKPVRKHEVLKMISKYFAT